MSQIYLFPELQRDGARSKAKAGELVAFNGVRLERTLQSVEFLRSLDDQSYLDRFNRVKPVPRDLAVERHRARLAEERRG